VAVDFKFVGIMLFISYMVYKLFNSHKYGKKNIYIYIRNLGLEVSKQCIKKK